MRFSSIRLHTYRLTHARLKKTKLPAAIPNELQVIQLHFKATAPKSVTLHLRSCILGEQFISITTITSEKGVR